MAVAIHRCSVCRKSGCVEYRRETSRGAYGRVVATFFRASDGVRCGSPLPVECCGRVTKWEWLRAWRNDAVKCAARCTHATGYDCECLCGGENHGKMGGLFTGLMAAA